MLPRFSAPDDPVPVIAGSGSTAWSTAVFPKDGCYAVPLKAAVHTHEAVLEDDTVTLPITIDGLGRPIRFGPQALQTFNFCEWDHILG